MKSSGQLVPIRFDADQRTDRAFGSSLSSIEMSLLSKFCGAVVSMLVECRIRGRDVICETPCISMGHS
jgi:hypothetical protein